MGRVLQGVVMAKDDDTLLDRILRIPPGTVLPPALRRIVEEVRNEQDGTVPIHRYDRVHSRHNRS